MIPIQDKKYKYIRTTISMPKFIHEYFKHKQIALSKFILTNTIQHIKEQDPEYYKELTTKIETEATHKSKAMLLRIINKQ